MSRAPRQINPSESVRHLFAWTLRQTRTQAGHSLQGFARRLGKSDSYLAAVELAEARCTRTFAADCERVLGAPGALLPLWAAADRESGQRTRPSRPSGARAGPSNGNRHARPSGNGLYRTPLQRERYLRAWSLQEVVDRVERLSWELDGRELGL